MKLASLMTIRQGYSLMRQINPGYYWNWTSIAYAKTNAIRIIHHERKYVIKMTGLGFAECRVPSIRSECRVVSYTRHSDFTLGTRIEKNMASEIFTQFIEASCKILKFKLNQVKDDMRYCIFFMGFFYFFLNECNHRYISKLRKRNWKIYCWGIPFSNVHRLACHAPWHARQCHGAWLTIWLGR